jgi:H+/Cl- antiporter ClcA
MAVRVGFAGTAPMFEIPPLAQPGPAALAAFVLLGAVVGVAAVAITRAVYGIEDLFDRLPVHWMWWPALGAVAVGVVGWMEPRTLGVGYDNIEAILSGNIGGAALATLAGLKLVSWSISLGSGTSGGTLAPLCTVGAGMGALLAAQLSSWFPELGIDPRVGALVGMSAMFAGASRAMLASVLFVF